jgi:serine/threonine-protein kinase
MAPNIEKAQTRTDAVLNDAHDADIGLAPGSIFHGDFLISENIAKRGGMGEVYKATNIINNTVLAIKMIRSDLSHSSELINKFIQEDEALRQLNNPAVVRYYGVRRETSSGRYYIQMEYVDGPTLGEFIRQRGAVPPDAAIALCRHLALGLQDAHRCGVVHRDISPDNILLGDSDLKQAKIIDFGIAKVASTGDFTTYRTSFIGKYRYASPEHFSAEAPIDQRSDIYSLGLVIATAAGAPLEMGRDELSGARARLSIPDLNNVPAALRPLLARMLDPDPARRPTASDLVVELSERRAPARRDGGSGTALWAGLAVALVVIAGGGGGAWLLLKTPSPPPAITAGPTITTNNAATSRIGSAADPAPGAGSRPAPTRQAPVDAVQRALAAEPGACTPLLPVPLDASRLQVSGLVAVQAAADRAKAVAESQGYAVDDRIAVSGPACQTLQLLGQLGKVNAPSGANRPILSANRTPAVFRIGETVGISAVVSLAADHHLYRIALDGAGGSAVIDHRVSHSFVDLSSNDPVTAAGWDLVAVIVSPHEIPAFDAARALPLDQLNAALLAEVSKAGNRHDMMSAYQFIRRVD